MVALIAYNRVYCLLSHASHVIKDTSAVIGITIGNKLCFKGFIKISVAEESVIKLMQGHQISISIIVYVYGMKTTQESRDQLDIIIYK